MLNHSQYLFIDLFFLNFTFNAIVSLSLVYCCKTNHLLKNPYTQKKYKWLLFTTVGGFIPFCGILINLWLLFFYRQFYNRTAMLDIRIFSMSHTLNEKKAFVPIYASGWADVRLKNTEFSKRERIRALSIINKNVSYSVNQLNKILLEDNVEELRLYAFSLIEKQRNYFNRNIFDLSKNYKLLDAPSKKAEIEKQLAIQYWEMIHLNLVEEDLHTLILEKCFFYINKATKILVDDGILWCLLAYCYFEKGENQNALAALSNAQQFKAPHTLTLPLIGEYHFKNHHYNQIKNDICTDISFLEVSSLAKIVDYWSHSWEK